MLVNLLLTVAVKSDYNLAKEVDDTNSRESKVCKYNYLHMKLLLGQFLKQIEYFSRIVIQYKRAARLMPTLGF